MNYLNTLKAGRDQSFQKLAAKLDTLAKGGSFQADPTYWSPKMDTAGNGFAIVRYLPVTEKDFETKGAEALPFVWYWDHSFKGPTGVWYINNSLTTLGQDDPVSKHNSVIWERNGDGDRIFVQGNPNVKPTVPGSKRRLYYVANVYVVQDINDPGAAGKVFKYKFGRKVFNKVNEASNPPFPDKPKFDPFDPWSGANFKIKIRKDKDFPNYDSSEFAANGPLFDDDAKLSEIMSQTHSLLDVVDPKKFKSFDELEKHLTRVLGRQPAYLNMGGNVALPTAKALVAPSVIPPWEKEDEGVSNNTDDAELRSFQALATR